MKTTVTFYPVDNGDCNLIEVENGPKILWDCKFRQTAENEENEDYDVINELTTSKLSKKKGLPFVDALILSHADKDHCHGFKDKIYHGDPADITDEDKKAGKILIGELWYSPRVLLEENMSDDATAFKKEAERRLELYRSTPAEANKDGNRLRIIGYADDQDLLDVADLVYVPGTKLSHVNGISYNNFRMFIHSPFKDMIEGADRNETSIAMQFRFDFDQKHPDAGKLILAGDAEWRVWEKIMSVNKEDENLHWNLFEAPHHCSWTFFSDDRERGDMNQASIDFLDMREENAFIVSSSKYISHMDSNPPCLKAKNRYIERVGKEHFVCTGGNKNGDTPTPIRFVLEKDGFRVQADAATETKLESLRNTAAIIRSGEARIDKNGNIQTETGLMHKKHNFYGENS